MCFTSAVISSRYCYLYTSKNNNKKKKGCIYTTCYVIMFTQPHTQVGKVLWSVKPWRMPIKRSFAQIYKSWFSSSIKSIYLCFPFLGLSQHYFTSDVAESSVLNGQGYINRYTLPQILAIHTFLLPVLWVWTDFQRHWQLPKTRPKPNYDLCPFHIRERLGCEWDSLLRKRKKEVLGKTF